jgi:membrane protein DedA with SNARE-associated domain
VKVAHGTQWQFSSGRRAAAKAHRPFLTLQTVEQQREEKRGQIALLLVRLLAGLAAGALLLFAVAGWLALDITNIKDVLVVVFPSVVALVGTVIGYYFGGRAGSPRNRRGTQ